jgi:hypothetical protein
VALGPPGRHFPKVQYTGTRFFDRRPYPKSERKIQKAKEKRWTPVGYFSGRPNESASANHQWSSGFDVYRKSNPGTSRLGGKSLSGRCYGNIKANTKSI